MAYHDVDQCRREIAALKKNVEDQRSEIVAVQGLNMKLRIENADLKKQAHHLKDVEAEHSSTVGVVENLRKQLVAKSAELNTANNNLVLSREARREADQHHVNLAKAHDSLRERFRGLLQQVSDLKAQLAKAKGDNATLKAEKEAVKRQLKASEDQRKEAEVTSAGLRLVLDAKNAELEEQRRLIEILREQFRALGGTNHENAAKSDPSEVLSAISSDFNGLVDSLKPAFAENRSADDSGIGSDVVAPLPVVEPVVMQQSFYDAVANGSADESGIVTANDVDVSPSVESSSSRATTENHPVLSRLLQQPPKPLRTAVKRPNFLQRVCVAYDKPAKQARVDPNAQ